MNEGFWSRQYALYLAEHKNPWNRRTHMVGVPLLLVTAIVGLARLDWVLIVGGQLVGWTIQIVGHKIEGNKPALLKNPVSFLMGPLLVLMEIVELVSGWQPAFARKARAAVFA